MIDLLPCPFCDEQPKKESDKPTVFSRMESALVISKSSPTTEVPVQLFWVGCPLCESRGPLHGTPDAAAATWNRRVKPSVDCLKERPDYCRVCDQYFTSKVDS